MFQDKNFESIRMNLKKIAIIGAGPIGLETAVYASRLGFEVDVYEKGRVGHNISRWGHVSLFSPWSMNHSPLAVKLLREQRPEWREPDESAMLTGSEFVQTYLIPLSRLPGIVGSIHEETEVLGISRDGLLKGDLIGYGSRADRQFRLLVRNSQGRESMQYADILIDVSGVYGNHNHLGSGGIPAIGERASSPFIEYGIPDISGQTRTKYAGKTTLLVGAGYSAATTVCAFARLVREEPDTRLIWAVRGKNADPIPIIENDALETRARLTAEANLAARSDRPGITCLRGAAIESIFASRAKETFEVTLKENETLKMLSVDHVIANVGYGPDNSIYRELQVHECFASRGPMNLAAALLAESSTDCLTQQSPGPDTLKNPEPNFYIIGNKSYGRNPTFLLRVGISQIVEIFSLIMKDPNFDLNHEPMTELEITT